MNAETLIFGYLLVLLGLVGAAALYDEFRRRSFEPARDPDRIFRCERCAFVYTDDPDVDRSRCPQCGRTNEPVKF